MRSFGLCGEAEGHRAQGHVEYHDHGADLEVRSISLTSVGCDSASSAYITGSARVNNSTQTFTVHVDDNGEPGKGVDTFSIILSGGYMASGALSAGNIQIH